MEAARSIRDNAGVAENKPEKSLWTRKVESDPEHSVWFVQRFRDMIAAGKDIAGEARFVDTMVDRGARILDAGCGSGRTGGPLAKLGHTVIGVDVDPVLIEAARQDWPDAQWILGDLAELDLPAHGITEPFDAVIAAGNVLPFLALSTRREVLTRLRATLAPTGRAAVGFGAGRGYPFEDFFEDCAATGWTVTSTFRGWNLLPFEPDSEFLVAVLEPRAPGRGRAGGTDAGASDAGVGRFTTRSFHRGAGTDPMGGNLLRPLT